MDWESDESLVLINPRMEEEILPTFWAGFHVLKGHVWIATSGSEEIKWVALSKKALLSSAEAVNRFLESDQEDVWVNVLPAFHVGGLSIQARAYLSKAAYFEVSGKWDPQYYYQTLVEKKGTLTSLVPTQLYDLVLRKMQAPSSLRAVIVGGGALSGSLKEQAEALGWPLHISYGMTECSSQIATAKKGSSDLTILPHVETKISNEGFLMVKGPSLLSGYLQGNQFKDPKVEGWYKTNDLVEIHQGVLKFLGRRDGIIKISGENVSFIALENLFLNITSGHPDLILHVKEDDRLGKRIVISTLSHLAPLAEEYKIKFNKEVMPYERITEVQLLNEIPRSPLGKVLKSMIHKKISQDVQDGKD